jgi:hypothetical protein
MMTDMFSGFVQHFQRAEASEEEKRETTIAKVIAVGFGLLWAVVIWFTIHGS